MTQANYHTPEMTDNRMPEGRAKTLFQAKGFLRPASPPTTHETADMTAL